MQKEGRRVALEARFQYDLFLEPQREHEPELHIWLSQTVSRDLHIHRLSGTRGFLEFRSEFEISSPPHAHLDPLGPPPYVHSESVQSLLWTACLNVDVFVRLRNLHGETCLNQAGSLRLPLGELMSVLSTDASRKLEYVIQVPSYGGLSGHFTPGARNDKGRLEISRASSGEPLVSFAPATRAGMPAVPPPPREVSELVRRVEQWKDVAFNGYIGACVDLFQRLRSTWKATSDINAYIYQCRADRALPACAYLAAPLGDTRADYFESALEIVMQRRGLRARDFDAKRTPGASAVLAEVLCLSAAHMTYTPDVVFLPNDGSPGAARKGKFLRALIESFDYARVRLGGDCEDLALEILLCAAELIRLSSLAAGSPVARLQDLASSYIFCMALGGVSSAEINGDYGQLTEMGAHMWSCAIPRFLFASWWMAGNGGELAHTMLDVSHREQDLKPLILEGTGFLSEAPGSEAAAKLEESARDVIRAAAPRGALGGLRKWYYYRRGRRNVFYQTVAILFTNHFLRTHESANVCFAVCRVNRGSSAPFTVGVEFGEFTAGERDSIAVWSEPELDARELDCVRDSIKDVHPMPGHRRAVSSPPDAAELDARLEALHAASRLRGGASAPSADPDRFVVAEYFASQHVLTRERCTLLESLCKKLAGVLVELRASKEHVTEGLLGYRLSFVFARGPAFDAAASRARRDLASGAAGGDEDEDC